MHRLIRGEEPDGLTRARNAFEQSGESPESAWGNFNDRPQIRDALHMMQDGFCAYCEGRLVSPHIDHFRRKGLHRELTFVWENLLLSCTHEEHCGRFKDRQSYSEPDLIDPGQEDPEEFLVFSTEGRLHPREGLRAPQRARESIRVLGLNQADLVDCRKRLIKQYAYAATLGFDVQGIRNLIAGKPYRTAILHSLLGTP